MDAKIVIKKDGSGKTWEYNILDSAGNSIMFSDGYESQDSIVWELTELKDSLISGLTNIVKE